MKKLFIVLFTVCVMFMVSGCAEDIAANGSKKDKDKTIEIGNRLAENQPTPTDIQYSLERYNLVRRAYWVNGEREKARNLPSPIADMPLGYAVLVTESGAVMGKFLVDGKITSLNSYLSPDSDYYEIAYGGSGTYGNRWLTDVDGSYGSNREGSFFFTPDGNYVEWTGDIMYTDIPVEINNPILNVKGE